jgi:hypothetical protein
VGGWASSETGVMGSNYLADGVPVPAGAHWRNGFAHSADGRRYVCPWPAAGIVHYRGKVAARPDGAMCIATAGTNAAVSRWALTARGEVLATESAPELVADGVGQLANGFVCLENVN